jgi:uncharacterized repeat protein (TIGR01451 family)
LIPCNDTTQTIEYYVCLENSVGVNSDSIIVQVNLPYGFTIASGSDFDATGRYKIPAGTISNTFCDTLKLKYNIDITKVATDRGHTITAGYTCHAYCVSEISDWVKVYPKNHAISVNKTVNNANPAVGDTIIFTYQICNISPLNISDIVLSDTFPSNLVPILYQTGPTLNGQILSYQISLDSVYNVTTPRCIQFSCNAVVKSSCKIPTLASIKSIANPCFKASNTLTLNASSAGNPVTASIIPISAVWCGNNIPLQAVITNPSGTYTYQWQKDGTNVGTNSVNHLATSNGRYSVKISQNGCSSVIEGKAFDTSFIVKDSFTHTKCTANIGSIYVTPKNGLKPYTYTWSASAVTDSFRINLPSGSYTVTVSDSIGCNKVLSFTINRLYDTLTMVNRVVFNPICKTNNGSISLASNGGTPPHRYNWVDGSILQNRTGLGADTFYVTVTDTNGCFLKDTVTLIKSNRIISVNDSTNKPQCGRSTGSIYLKPSGGYSNYYTYLWSNNSTQSSIINVPTKSYYVTVTDTMGCEVVDTIKLLSLADSNFKTVDSICATLCYTNSGAIYLDSLTGTPPYKFLWNTGDTLQSLDSLDSGTYTVMVTDSADCKLYDTFIVPRSEGDMDFTYSHTYDCSIMKATTKIVPTKGHPPYYILWSNNDTSRYRTNMSAGLDTFEIFDTLGCRIEHIVDISFQNLFLNYATITHPNCGNKGKIVVTPDGGVPPHTYYWGDLTSFGDSIRTNLSPGSYPLTITDSNNCSIEDTFVMQNDPKPSNLDARVTIKINCTSADQAIITATPIAGNAPFTYLWNTGATAQSIALTNLTPYTVTITEQGGCAKVFRLVLSAKDSIYLSTRMIVDTIVYVKNYANASTKKMILSNVQNRVFKAGILVDSGYTLEIINNSVLEFGDNAMIEVKNKGALRISNSTLRSISTSDSCDARLW